MKHYLDQVRRTFVIEIKDVDLLAKGISFDEVLLSIERAKTINQIYEGGGIYHMAPELATICKHILELPNGVSVPSNLRNKIQEVLKQAENPT